MSVRNTVRALPTLMRVSFAEAVAYRAEMLIWILSTTMPLVMLALFSAVAREAPIGRFRQRDFAVYFLATFVVRQLTGVWAAWQMNFEVRSGALAQRLLRPISPVMAYAVEHVAAVPMRLLLALPVAVIAFLAVGRGHVASDPVIWAIWCAAIAGAWLITFAASIGIGALSLYMESSLKVMDVWLAAFFVFSGYLIPVELFPRGLRVAANWMPFRYMIGFPVELMTSALGRRAALLLLARQGGFVAVLMLGVALLWRRGLRRFAAYGG